MFEPGKEPKESKQGHGEIVEELSPQTEVGILLRSERGLPNFVALPFRCA
jgi:hypothetical protein